MKRTKLEAAVLRLFKLHFFTRLVFRLRFFWLARIRRKLRVYEDESGVLAGDYSLGQLKAGRPATRILDLIRPLVSIDKVTSKSSIVSIGCRFEADLLYLCGYGFDPRRVKGLDMISYSPWVDCGNMHKMDYADDTWDVVLMGWVMTYSDTPDVAAKEVVRVTKPGGLVAIGVTYEPPHRLEALQQQGNIVSYDEEHPRMQTVKQYTDLFGEHVDRVYFAHDVADPTKGGRCLVIFSVKK